MSTAPTYAQHSDAFTAVVTELPEWDASSPCEGWSARDVLQHVMDTQRDFLTGKGVDLGTAPELDDPAATWQAHDRAVRAVLNDPEVAGRELAGAFGPTTIAATMDRFYGFDLIVHRWDLAQAAGRDERFSEVELDLLETSVAGFGEHLYAEGICKSALEVEPGADRQTAILARMGRAAAQ